MSDKTTFTHPDSISKSSTVDAKKLIVELVAENAELRESNEELKRTAKYHQLQHQRNARNFRRTADELKDLKTQYNKLKEAANKLHHLHLCEQEGIASGQPTAQEWFEAVNNLEELLTPKE